MGAVGFFKVSKALNSIAFSIYPNYFSFYTPISTDECGELKKIALIFGVFFSKIFRASYLFCNQINYFKSGIN